MQKPIDVAVLGATGAVGQRFIQLLEGHPWMRVGAVIASDRSAGKPYCEAANWVLDGKPPTSVANMEVLPLDAEPDTPLMFSALPSNIARERELDLAAAGYVVCSNASAFRMEPDVPLLIPEVNADHVALVDVQRQRVRHELFAPPQRDNLLEALLSPSPDLVASARAVAVLGESDELTEEENDDDDEVVEE